MRLLLLLLLSPFVFLVGCADPDLPTTGRARSDQEHISWNFFVTGEAASITEDSSPTQWKISISQVQPTLLAYSDRPQRDTSIFQVADFVSTWSALFKGANGVEVSPNAVISGKDSGNQRLTPIPVILTNPVYDASLGTLVFDATPLEPNRTLPTNPYDITEVSLAIDAVDFWDVIKDCGLSALQDPSVLFDIGDAIATCGGDAFAEGTLTAECVESIGGGLVTAIEDMLQSHDCRCAVCKELNRYGKLEGCYTPLGCTGADSL